MICWMWIYHPLFTFHQMMALVMFMLLTLNWAVLQVPILYSTVFQVIELYWGVFHVVMLHTSVSTRLSVFVFLLINYISHTSTFYNYTYDCNHSTLWHCCLIWHYSGVFCFAAERENRSHMICNLWDYFYMCYTDTSIMISKSSSAARNVSKWPSLFHVTWTFLWISNCTAPTRVGHHR